MQSWVEREEGVTLPNKINPAVLIHHSEAHEPAPEAPCHVSTVPHKLLLKD